MTDGWLLGDLTPGLYALSTDTVTCKARVTPEGQLLVEARDGSGWINQTSLYGYATAEGMWHFTVMSEDPDAHESTRTLPLDVRLPEGTQISAVEVGGTQADGTRWSVKRPPGVEGNAWVGEVQKTETYAGPFVVWNEGEHETISSTGAKKNVKLARYDLIPANALRKVAEHYGIGAKKYADHNWRAGYEWSKSFQALQRHAWLFWSGADNDPETGSPHMAAVVFHALALLEYPDTHPEFDDRWAPTNIEETE